MPAATLMIRLVTDASKAQKGMGDAAKSAEKTQGRIKSSMAKVGGAIAGAFAADKIIGFAKDSIGAASDLSETMSKTSQIFGDSSDAIVDWSKNSSEAFGLSQKDALDAAGTFAIFGKAAGLTGSDLTDFSESLTGTASDFASFANTTPQEAIEAIGAALRGETEPIRKYGLMLNDASIKNEAMRLGLIKTTKVPIDPKKRSLAVKSLIDAFAKGQKITGDFARTSGGLANQQRIMAAKIENVKATIGAQLLPVVLLAITSFQNLAHWIKENIRVLAPLAAVIGTVVAAWYTYTKVMKIVRWATLATTKANFKLAASFLTNPIVLIIAAIIALAIGLVVLYRKSETFRKIVDGAFRAVATAGRVLWDALKAAFNAIIGAAQTVWSAIKAVAAGIAAAFGAVIRVIAAVARVIGTVLKVAFTVAAVGVFILILPLILLGKALMAIWQATETLRAKVVASIGAIVAVFATMAAAVGRALAAVARVIIGPFLTAWRWIRDTMIPALKAVWSTVAAAVGRGLAAITRTITAPFRAAWGWIRDSLIPALKGGWSTVAGAVGRALSAVSSAITGPFRAAWDWIKLHIVAPMKSMFTGLAGAITHAMSGVYAAIIGPFKAAWQWIRDNVLAPIKSAWNGVANAINAIHVEIKVPSNVLTRAAHIAGKGFTFDPPNLPTLARGAYVRRATPAIFGEAGPEIVAPEAILRRIAREESGPTYIVNVSGALDPDAVARQIDQILRRRARRNGGVRGPVAVST